MTDDLPQLVQWLVEDLAGQQAMPDDSWRPQLAAILTALDTLTRALAERTQERDTLLGELRADPEGLPNLLRINREYAERCNQDTNKALAAVLEARAETEQLRREVNYQRARAVDAEARLAAESVRATAARVGQP